MLLTVKFDGDIMPRSLSVNRLKKTGKIKDSQQFFIAPLEVLFHVLQFQGHFVAFLNLRLHIFLDNVLSKKMEFL